MKQITDNIYVLVIIVMTGTFILVIFFLLLSAYTHNKILKQKQLLYQTEIFHQKDLVLTVIQSQEEERKRIGGDLHDSVGAALSSLRLVIDNGSDGLKQDCKNIIDRIITDTRHICHHLSPAILTLYGLSEAVAELADTTDRSGALNIQINNQAEEILNKLPNHTSLSIYRVLEELMNNTIKHACAENVIINFLYSNELLVITYTDDGKGYDEQVINKGMGLLNITNRLKIIEAAYEIKTGPALGFHINITLHAKD